MRLGLPGSLSVTKNTRDVTSSQGAMAKTGQGWCYPSSREEGSLQPTQLPHQPHPEDLTWREAQEAKSSSLRSHTPGA